MGASSRSAGWASRAPFAWSNPSNRFPRPATASPASRRMVSAVSMAFCTSSGEVPLVRAARTGCWVHGLHPDPMAVLTATSSLSLSLSFSGAIDRYLLSPYMDEIGRERDTWQRGHARTCAAGFPRAHFSNILMPARRRLECRNVVMRAIAAEAHNDQEYPRLNFAPYWEMTNDNLIELIDLVPEEKLDWSPGPREWSIRVITTHIILARHHNPIVPAREGAQTSDVVLDCRTKEGLGQHLRSAWGMVAAPRSDRGQLG